MDLLRIETRRNFARMPGSNLYFIALVPPPHICSEVMYFKHDLGTRFESSEALKVMPHITLKAPFKFPFENTRLIQWFNEMRIQQIPFKIEMKDFGSFPNKDHPVIYVCPVMSTPLYSLQRELIRSFRINFPQIKIIPLELKFNPHMTVAYRDLKPELFRKAWEEYKIKKYSATFEVNCFYLLQHNYKKWNIISTKTLK